MSEERKKIMILVATYYPLQDGVQAVTQYIAEGLAQKHEVLVVTSMQSGLERRSELKGVAIERYRAVRNPYTMQFVGEKEKIRKRIMDYNPDILMAVCVQTWCYDWIKKRLNSFPGKKILYTHGCSCLGEYAPGRLVRRFRLRRQIVADVLGIYIEWYWQRYQKHLFPDMSRFDKIIYLHEKDAFLQLALQKGLKNGYILENAVDKVFFEQKTFMKQNKDEVTFINVSSYNENKNQKMILQAFYEADLPGAALVLIGSQPTSYYQELVELNGKLEKEKKCRGKVEILCGISRQQVIQKYKEADVYVSGSGVEVMSISLCESAAAGMTIMATDAGHATLIPGVIICSGTHEFADAMRYISRNPSERISRGKKGYEYALEHYDIQRKVEQMEKILLED